MDDESFKKAKEEMEQRARADAEPMSREERGELVKERALLIMAMLKDMGIAKNATDTAVTVLALARASGMGCIYSNLDFAQLVDHALAGRQLGRQVVDYRTTELALTALATKPQGNA
jgi:hypothetical protein